MSARGESVERAAGSRPEFCWISGRLPWLSAGLGLLCIGAFALDGVTGTALEWSRTALARGELWRALTGHFVHWSANHLAWDVAVFIVLASLLEDAGRRALVGLLVGASVVLSIALLVVEPGLARYRGLSGLDSVLYAAVCVELFDGAWRARDRVGLCLAGLLGLGFVAKLVGEAAVDRNLFVNAPTGVVPVATVHVLGAALGLAFGRVRASWRRPAPVRPSSRMPV